MFSSGSFTYACQPIPGIAVFARERAAGGERLVHKSVDGVDAERTYERVDGRVRRQRGACAFHQPAIDAVAAEGFDQPVIELRDVAECPAEDIGVEMDELFGRRRLLPAKQESA